MKRRIRKIVNFFAFNLLFFALYLNFIHKDKTAIEPVPAKINAAASINGTIPVQDADRYLNARTSVTQTAVEKSTQENVMKPAIN